MTIEHLGIQITPDAIKCKLLDMQVDAAGSDCGTSAFGAKGKFEKTSRSGAYNKKKFDKPADTSKEKDMNGIICFKCKQGGHYMSKCPNMQNSIKSENKNAFSAIFLSGNFNKNDFYLNSGASRHMTPNEEWIENSSSTTIHEITVTNQEKLTVKSSADLDITTYCNS